MFPSKGAGSFVKKQPFSETNPFPPPHKMPVPTACRARKFVASSSESSLRNSLHLSSASQSYSNIENSPLLSESQKSLHSSLEGEIQRLSDLLIDSQLQVQFLNQALVAQRQEQNEESDAYTQALQQCALADSSLVESKAESTGRENQLVIAIEELDRERCRILNENKRLQEFLSQERERSATAAVDLDFRAAANQRRCEELEELLQAARDEGDNASKELACVQASNEALTAQLHEVDALHRQRCDALAASLNAAEEGHRAVQQQLEDAFRDVDGVKAQLQGSTEREAAACARACALEAQLAASDAATSQELDRLCRKHAQDCDELRELLSQERELSSELQCQIRFCVVESSSRCFGNSSLHSLAFGFGLHDCVSSLSVETESQTDNEFDKVLSDFERYQR